MIFGAVDFIYGGANAVFDHCTIWSIGNGAVTAPNTDYQMSYGLTFLQCNLTSDPKVNQQNVYLGRTWGAYARANFLNSFEGDHINPLGWNNMGHPEYQPTVHVAEYNNFGSGSNIQKRVDWSSQLTPAQALNFTLKNIFGDWIPPF